MCKFLTSVVRFPPNKKQLIIKMSCEDHLLRKGRALKPGLKKPGPKTGLLSLCSVLRVSVLLHFPLSSSFCLLFSTPGLCVRQWNKKKKRSKVTHLGNSSLQSMLSHLKGRMEIWRAHRRLCPLWNRLTDVIGHIPPQNWASGLYDSRLLIHQWGLDGGGGWMAEKSHFISLLHYFPWCSLHFFHWARTLSIYPFFNLLSWFGVAQSCLCWLKYPSPGMLAKRQDWQGCAITEWLNYDLLTGVMGLQLSAQKGKNVFFQDQ